MDFSNVLLFNLHPDYSLGKNISAELGIPISPSKVTRFADGEIFIKPLVSVKDKIVFVTQSICSPVNTRVMETLIFTSACKLNGAKEVILLVPYLAYSRQDRIIEEGDPISAKLFADLLYAAGVDRIVSADLHNAKIPTFFNIPIINLNPLPLLADTIRKQLLEMGIGNNEICVVSPDKGSINRAKVFSSLLPGSSVAYMDKYRPKPNEAIVTDLHGDVRGKKCIIVDDMIDTGGTVMACSNFLVQNGCDGIAVGATHGIFSNEAIQKLYLSHIHNIIISDSIDVNYEDTFVFTLAPLYAMYMSDYLKSK